MSYWTHITACIYLETGIEDKNIKSIVEEKLKLAPKITGSEGNVDIFVMPLSGYNVWTNCDCNKCPYKETIKYCEDGGFICESKEGFICPEGKYQTSVCISIIGNLRDRFKEETKKEYKEFIKWLQSNFTAINLMSCTIR